MTDEHVERLRAVAMFAELPDDALARVARSATEVEIEPGHVLIQPGQEGSGLFVLLDGTAVVELSGRHVECGPGEFLGELSMLVPGVVHTARVRAATIGENGSVLAMNDLRRLGWVQRRRRYQAAMRVGE